MIRKILVPVRGDGKGENVLAHAAVLAKRFNAHIVVNYCKARPEDMIPYGVPLPSFVRDMVTSEAAKLSDTEEETLREEFGTLCRKYDLEITSRPSDDHATASWASRAGRQIDVIKHYGRLADLICVAKPDRSRNLGTNTLKAALFSTGRPVMMCPPTQTIPADLGAHITIAWNGSTEASRAVALTLNVIDESASIHILRGGKGDIHGATAEDLKDYLALRGITSTVETFETKSQGVGATLLATTRTLGAGLMVMGAYGESYEKEAVLGGNTQTVVDTADIPVIMVH